jgi:protein transport protein SEC31
MPQSVESASHGTTSALPEPLPTLPLASYDAHAVVDVLRALLERCNAFDLLPMDKRKMDDVDKRLKILFQKLLKHEVTVGIFEKLEQLCQALSVGDYQAALGLHVAITTTDWADNGAWLMGLKRLIEMVSKFDAQGRRAR